MSGQGRPIHRLPEYQPGNPGCPSKSLGSLPPALPLAESRAWTDKAQAMYLQRAPFQSEATEKPCMSIAPAFALSPIPSSAAGLPRVAAVLQKNSLAKALLQVFLLWFRLRPSLSCNRCRPRSDSLLDSTVADALGVLLSAKANSMAH